VLAVASGGFTGIRASQEAEEQEAGDEDLIVVGFSQLGSESEWRLAHTQSIQDALSKENGFFLQYDNARQKQENQIKAIRGFISQRVDYIVFSPLMEDGWETVLTEAKEAGIPVILVDRKISGSEDLYTTFIGSDMEAEGRKAGEWLADYERRRGNEDETVNILVLKGTEGSTSQLGRSRGFDEVAAEHENWNILAQESGDFTVVKGKEAMASLLRKYADVDIDVVVSQNDEMTFGAMEAISEMGLTTGVYGQIALISFDGVGDALKLVDSGRINCEVQCNPGQGELVAEVIKKLAAGETVEKEYYVEEQVFTRENVEAYIDSHTD
jgi:simple sugar transport system substrate-binding protein